VDAKGRLGQEIRQIRRGQRMTQGELAEKANVSLITISRLERGERDPHLETLARVAKGLGVQPFELLRSAGYFEHEGDPETEE
jgi:transcriptional regulator with XRE-family HTH domain